MSRSSNASALARHELRILRRDPLPFIITFAFPLILMAFTKPAFGPTLVSSGHAGANGAEQAVPGLTVMFSLFLMSNVGFAFFREREWATWSRMRASGATTSEIMLGKLLPNFASLLLLITALLVVGGVLFDLQIAGSPVLLVPLVVALAAFEVAFGVFLASVTRTVSQINAVANLLTFVLAGIGGAITPLESLPGWAQAVSPVSPANWAMRGFGSVIRGGTGVAGPTIALLAAAVVLALLAVPGFRRELRRDR